MPTSADVLSHGGSGDHPGFWKKRAAAGFLLVAVGAAFLTWRSVAQGPSGKPSPRPSVTGQRTAAFTPQTDWVSGVNTDDHEYTLSFLLRNDRDSLVTISQFDVRAASGRVVLKSVYPGESFPGASDATFAPTPISAVQPGGTAGVLVRVSPDCSASNRRVDLALTYQVDHEPAQTQRLIPPAAEGGKDPFLELAAEVCKAPLAALAPAMPQGSPSPTGPALARVAEHLGSLRLPTFTPRSRTLNVTFSCLGPGKFALGTLFDLSPCDGISSTVVVRVQAGTPESLTVNTAPTTVWRVLVQDSP